MFRRGAAVAEAPAANVLQLRQQLFAIGDDYWIEDANRERLFKVDGKALRLRKTLVLEDAAGAERYRIQEKLAMIRDAMEIGTAAGRVATVKKALISPLRERYEVTFDRGGEWTVQGKIADHEYTIESDAGLIAEVGKRWFRVRDTYGIRIATATDDALAGCRDRRRADVSPGPVGDRLDMAVRSRQRTEALPCPSIARTCWSRATRIWTSPRAISTLSSPRRATRRSGSTRPS